MFVLKILRPAVDFFFLSLINEKRSEHPNTTSFSFFPQTCTALINCLKSNSASNTGTAVPKKNRPNQTSSRVKCLNISVSSRYVHGAGGGEQKPKPKQKHTFPRF